MMENTTDRLFWTLTSVILGALLLTVSVKAFPNVASSAIQPMSGLIKQADIGTKNVKKAGDDAISNETSQSNGSSSNSSSTNNNTADPEASAKANAVEASTLNLKVTPNGDGTGVLNGPASGKLSGSLNIPEYVKVNGQLTKITSIGDSAFDRNTLTSVIIPNSVTNIADWAFSNNQLTSLTIPNNVTTIGKGTFGANQLTSINIPNSVTNIGDEAFRWNNLTSVNIPNAQGYKSAVWVAFDSDVYKTNNPSN